jgi:TRAP-type C4-dicarboxylate transport system permease small subunit
MKRYKLTTPRTILFAILFIGGIYYFSKNGFKSMDTYEIILSAVLMVALFAMVLIKLLGASKTEER